MEQDKTILKLFSLHKEIGLKRFFFNNSYLLVIAAWLVTISFIIDNYWSVNSSARAVEKNITTHIHEEEKRVEALVDDTANKIGIAHI
jgi:hypothetical protein